MGLRAWLFACMYDRMCAGVEEAGLRSHRERLLAAARGRVLEIGAGTGANLPFYGSAVESVTATDPEPPMARRLARKVEQHGRRIEIVAAPAERLPLGAAEFDTVVCTLVLCTVRDQRRALEEIRRVLKPDGSLLFLEHVRSDDPKLAAWQDRLNPVNRAVACGCNCNRATVYAIRQAGFTITSLQNETLPKAPPFIRPLVIGAAQPAVSH